MYSLQKLKYWLIAVFAIETFCITYGLKAPALIPFFTCLYFLSGIAIAILLLYFPEAKTISGQTAALRMPASLLKKFLFLAGLGMLIYFLADYWFKTLAVDIQNADMLPVIRVMDQRFIAGQWKHVYDIIPEIWGGTQPIYLPATWMPFSLGSLFNIDMRWVSAACLLFAFSVAASRIYAGKQRSFSFLLSAITFVFFWWLLTEDDVHGFISVSEEGVVMTYYVILVMALLSGNIYVTAVAISLCMLSRYALIGWVPAFVMYLWFDKKKKEIVVMALIGLAILFGLFILPFGWQNFIKLAQLPGNYIDFAKRVWHDSPEVFSITLGFAKFYGPNNITSLHHTLIALTFIVPSLFTGYCLIQRKKKNVSNIALAALKLGLVFFYSFIDVPYLYLFYTSTFVSLLLVCFFVPHLRPSTQVEKGATVGQYD